MRWALLVITGMVCAVYGDEICLTTDDNPYLLFGSKTAYIFGQSSGQPNKPRVHEVPGCQPVAFWLLNRHGSVNPETEEFPQLQKLADLKNNIINNYASGNYRNTNERICQADVTLLGQWLWNPIQDVSHAGELTGEGYMSTQQLAKAWKQRFPGLLTDNRHDYLFKFGKEQKAKTTFAAFTEGLFGAQAEGYDIPRSQDEDLLKPYKNCPAWSKNIGDNNETLSQRVIFESKREYREMITNVSRRLGFNYDIDSSTVRNIYEMCRYNKAWAVDRISPWCSPFSREDLRRLEYAEDLETYYKYGPGNDLNSKVGCSLIGDMINFFSNHVENDIPQQPRTLINFVNMEAILMSLTSLNARRGAAPITGDNYHSAPAQSRKWTTSSMTPYHGNIAAVLYKCSPNGNFQIKDQYQVLFLENEQEMFLEGCRVGLCDWSYVKDRFSEITHSCNREKQCNGSSKLEAFYGLILAVFILFGVHL